MEKTNEEAIETLLKSKNLNLMRGDSDDFSFGRIAFGIPALDNLTGGGIPKKRMTIMDVMVESERRVKILVSLAWYICMICLAFFAFLTYLVVTN